MKNKRFDCVEMKHKGAERVHQAIVGLSWEQQAHEKATPARCK